MSAQRVGRLVLPGLAFKTVVIGGGDATGRELVEVFLPSGPVGGVWAMRLAAPGMGVDQSLSIVGPKPPSACERLA